ncbi:flagellar hook-associated protein FlgL [Cohnella massiliensis]|uniref:flagellar hook-associated protein FlgL n=1 Tax=Cohnella massiliensis TaxID=1816691 RepID=UPI0009BABBAA|nr:flagellar hook-associated protein FlgL [Cohnella massiliensis]
MAGRVTQATMTSQLLRNINTNLTRMQGNSEKLSTGMRINRPSDDPVGITYALRYRSDLSINERYQTNADYAASLLDFNDTLLTQTGDILKRVKELAVQGSNGTQTETSRETIAVEMEQLKEQLVNIANSTFKGKYVFSGQEVDQVPYASGVDPKTVVTDSEDISYMVGAGVKVSVNLTGNDVFGYPPTGVTAPQNEDDNVFHVLDQMIGSLRNDNMTELKNQITALESRTNKILTQQAQIGARVNRVELVQSRLEDLNLNLTTLQSKVEDAEYEELIIKSKVDESVYQASLSIGANIIQASLVDFLR